MQCPRDSICAKPAQVSYLYLQILHPHPRVHRYPICTCKYCIPIPGHRYPICTCKYCIPIPGCTGILSVPANTASPSQGASLAVADMDSLVIRQWTRASVPRRACICLRASKHTHTLKVYCLWHGALQRLPFTNSPSVGPGLAICNGLPRCKQIKRHISRWKSLVFWHPKAL
jgi:hypothetical protein